MNPISAFFVRNIIVVFFFYGLAFFAMGLALALASRRTSELRFAQAIRPLAAFGILHGLHEWIEMFQKIASLTTGYTPAVWEEAIRLLILTGSFVPLMAFGLMLLSPLDGGTRRLALSIAGMVGLWLIGTLAASLLLSANPEQVVALADVLARYSLGIPGALLGAWAMMTQQQAFREHGMPQFGRDLVWSTTALLLYGVVGQVFVRETALFPSTVLNSTLFLRWFGIPVQLFRGVMATMLAYFMVRALNAFELESQRRLEEANQARLAAQAGALQAERRTSRQMEQLNEELQLTTRELSLLLNLSNLLAVPMALKDRLQDVVQRLVQSLEFPSAGMILLVDAKSGEAPVQAASGFASTGNGQIYLEAVQLGEYCIASGKVICRHEDGTILEVDFAGALQQPHCHLYASPADLLALPLTVQEQVIGSLVLAQARTDQARELTVEELQLILGVARQLGLSVENARLYQVAHERERMLGDLLHQVVDAQENERQRIARELHDATGQSLSAIAMGLRGVEKVLGSDESRKLSNQVQKLRSFSMDALGELRQIISDLRPAILDDMGLAATLQWYVQGFQQLRGIETDLQVSGNQVRLPSEHETVLFRITQEALTNIAKHAQASHVAVRLDVSNQQVSLLIEDDGIGFDVERALSGEVPVSGWGLLGMQERTSLLGGQYQITSKPGHGTRIQVVVPLMVRAREDKEHDNQGVSG